MKLSEWLVGAFSFEESLVETIAVSVETLLTLGVLGVNLAMTSFPASPCLEGLREFSIFFTSLLFTSSQEKLGR